MHARMCVWQMFMNPIKTSLGSNFFNFLSLINSTEDFEKDTSSLVCFAQLGSEKYNSNNTSTNNKSCL